MKLVSFMNNLILRINCQHLLKNGAGKAHNDVFNNTVEESKNIFAVIIDYLAVKLADVANFLLRILFQLAYFIIKLALNVMDFLMVIVSELSGQAQSFDMAKANSNLESSDVLFKFLFNSLTLKILKRVFIYSLLLLIIISIIAIVKNEWQRAQDEKARDAKAIIVKMAKSILVMFLTPFVVIVGIIFSNVLLVSSMNAINGGKNFFSVGSVIFMSGTYNANWYRTYADNNDKIPILFDFNGGFYNVDNGDDKTSEYFDLEDEIKALKNNNYLTSGYSTYSMFQNKAYFAFNEVPEDSSYYAFYDGDFLKTKRIEYYVMADFIDHAMETGQEFYIKNVEDVYNIAYDTIYEAKGNGVELFPEVTDPVAGADLSEEDYPYYKMLASIFDNITVYKAVEGGEDELLPLYDEAGELAYDYRDAEYFSFNVYYNGELLNGCGDVKANSAEVEVDGEVKTVYTETPINYQALSGADDEAFGAKYVYCYKTRIPVDVDGNVFRTVYIPVLKNSNNNSYFSFDSDYLQDGSVETRPTETMFVARGGFNQSGAPTAIREDGNMVVFYRHDADSKSLLKVKPQLSYIESDDKGNQSEVEAEGDFFSRVLGFDQDNVQGNLDIKGKSMPTFTKSLLNVTHFTGGLYKLNYSFVGTRLELANVYDIVNVNFVILIFACWNLMATFFFLIFSLLKRLLELTVFWFTYPAWLVTFPLDSGDNITEGTTFAMWRSNFIDRVLSVYTTYIGLVFFYALIPIILDIDFAGSIVESASEQSWFSYIPPTFISWVIRAMFILVLFTFVEKVNDIVNDFIGGGRMSSISDGKDVFGSIKKNVVDGVTTFSVTANAKKLKNKALSTLHEGALLIPGKAGIDAGVTAVRHGINNARATKAVNALVTNKHIATATDASVVNDTNKMKDTTKKYAERAKKIEAKATKRGKL